MKPPLPAALRLSRTAAAVLLCATLSAPAAAAGDGFTRHLAQLINAYRAQHGLSPLDAADDLAALADEHSGAMAAASRLSHEGFRTRFRRAGGGLCVENVAWNYRTPEALLEGWRQSPEHHRNLLEPRVSRMGLAVATRYVTWFACR